MKPGYKQTEVGVIPEEWEARQIRDVCKLINGRGFKPHEWKTDGLPIIRIQNLNGSEDFNYYTGQYNPKILVEHGQLLFAWSGSRGTSFGPHVWSGGRALLNYHTWKVAVNESEATPEFLLYALRHLTSFIEDRAHGASALVHTQKWEMEKFHISMPSSLKEQRAIAEALGDVDALLGALDRLIAKKRDLKQAAMQQLLTGQTRLPGFHGDWEQTQVQDVITGFFCGPSPTCEERNIQDESEWGVLKTTAATKENGWDWTKHKTLPRPFWNRQHLELKKGDVIVTKAGPRHRVGVAAWVDFVPPRIIVSGKMIGLRPRHDKVVPLMLAAGISARDAQLHLDQRTTGMAESQVNFENNALLEAPIRIPDFDEQTAIAAVLTDMDAELAALEQRRAKTRALKQGMMQELLTGRTRLV